jgi:hypothetical protein
LQPDDLALLVAKVFARPEARPLIPHVDHLTADAVQEHIRRAYAIYSTGGPVNLLSKGGRDDP